MPGQNLPPNITLFYQKLPKTNARAKLTPKIPNARARISVPTFIRGRPRPPPPRFKCANHSLH